MTAGSALVKATDVLADVAERVGRCLAERRQPLLLDGDPESWLSFDEPARERLAELVRFASRHAPVGCELLLAAARPDGRVAVAGAGRIVLRWQLDLGARSLAKGENVIPMRAEPRTAEALLSKADVRSLVGAFSEAGAGLAFDVLGDDDEIRATLSLPGT